MQTRTPIYNTQSKLRTIYESCRNQGGAETAGARWEDLLRNKLLGLHKDRKRGWFIKDAAMSPYDFASDGNLAETAYAILGPDAPRLVSTPRTVLLTEALAAQAAGGRSLYEAGNTAIQPSQFIDISSWDVTVGGLIEARMIEEYRKPEYVMDRLFQNFPTNLHAQKLIGTSRIGDRAIAMQPGQSHPSAQFTERFITTPYTIKYGVKCEVTKEAVFFDRTNQVLERAGSIGMELGLRKEYLCCDVFLGTVNPYIYDGVSYNTYLTSGVWTNDLTGNSLIGGDVYNLQNAWVAGQNMRDQEANQPITIHYDTVVCAPGAKVVASAIIKQQQFQMLSSGSGSVYNAGLRTEAPPPEDLYGESIGGTKLIWSPYLNKRMTDSAAIGGMGLSQSQANNYWFYTAGDEAFRWMENWDVNIVTVDTSSYTMADQGIIMAAIGDFMATPAVFEPRKVIRSRT